MNVYISDLLGRPLIDAQAQPIGHLGDLVARASSDGPPQLVGLVVQRRREEFFLPIAEVGQLAPETPHLVLVATPPTLSRFVRRADDMLLGREIVDHEVIDLRVPRVVRVNDVLLDVSPAGWQVAGVDIGVPALLRRLLPRPLRRDIDTAAHLLRWDDLDLLARLVPDSVLPADHRRLASISPADLAGIAAAVPPRQAAALIATLDDARAAATLAELCAERRAAVLAMLNSARIPRILEHTAPVAAAAAPAPLPSTARP